MNFLPILFIAACLAFPAAAQTADTQKEMTVTEAQAQLQDILNESLVEAAEPLNKKVDYIASSYDDGELRALIKNYEKTNRKIAARQGKKYVPYDRKIDVSDPQKVKRYLRKRIDIIF